jgi:hypothetical protein
LETKKPPVPQGRAAAEAVGASAVSPAHSWGGPLSRSSHGGACGFGGPRDQDGLIDGHALGGSLSGDDLIGEDDLIGGHALGGTRSEDDLIGGLPHH